MIVLTVLLLAGCAPGSEAPDAPVAATDGGAAMADAAMADAAMADAAMHDTGAPLDAAAEDGGVATADVGLADAGSDAGPPSPPEVRRIDFTSSALPSDETFYLVYLPEGYEGSGISYPMMIFYVGSGEIGTSEAALSRQGPFRTIRENGGRAPSGFGMDQMIFVVNNQPIANSNNTHLPLAWEVYQDVTTTFRVDTTRVYVTGLSMGANGAHSMAIAHPEAFAASIAVSGANARVTDSQACSVYGAGTALWVLHGTADTPGYGITPANARGLYDRVRACPPSHAPRYTLVQGRGHNGTFWNEVYSNTGTTAWTLVAPGLDALDEPPSGSIYEWALLHHR
jgi:hypothetical protein